MGIVIPFPSRAPRQNRRRLRRRRQPIGVLTVPPRGEASITFVAKRISRVERLIFRAALSRDLFVDALSIEDSDMLLGTVPLQLLCGAPIDLPTMSEGHVLRLSVRNAGRSHVVLPVRAEMMLLEPELRRR